MIVYGLRCTGVLLGMFGMLNLLGGMFVAGFDANIWWIDLRWLPWWAGASVVGVCAGLIVLAGLRPGARKLQLWAGCACAVLAAATVADAVRFYVLTANGSIASEWMAPASLLFTLALVGAAVGFARKPRELKPGRRAGAWVMAIGACGSLPVLLMTCFGTTDYRRGADAVLVFGARAYADGSPSDALADRVRTACELYHQGLAPCLVLSGGPGDGHIHEAEAMRRMAAGLGVPESAMILDQAGTNTTATIQNAADLGRARGIKRYLAVSHFYHLPRIKMEAARHGVEVFTVPAAQGQPLRKLPWFVARETVAWWRYYVRPVV